MVVVIRLLTSIAYTLMVCVDLVIGSLLIPLTANWSNDTRAQFFFFF